MTSPFSFSLGDVIQASWCEVSQDRAAVEYQSALPGAESQRICCWWRVFSTPSFFARTSSRLDMCATSKKILWNSRSIHSNTTLSCTRCVRLSLTRPQAGNEFETCCRRRDLVLLFRLCPCVLHSSASRGGSTRGHSGGWRLETCSCSVS